MQRARRFLKKLLIYKYLNTFKYFKKLPFFCLFTLKSYCSFAAEVEMRGNEISSCGPEANNLLSRNLAILAEVQPWIWIRIEALSRDSLNEKFIHEIRNTFCVMNFFAENRIFTKNVSQTS